MNAFNFIRKKQPANKSPAIHKSAITRIRFIAPFLVFITCLLISFLVWNLENTSAENELRSYFEFRVRDVNSRIELRLNNYEQILRSVRGLFIASNAVDRNEFHSFFNSLHLDKNYPGVQGVGFSLIISPDQIKKNISGIRKEGFPNYKVWPVGKRNIYTSIIYIEPFKDRNLRAFGYDMFSEPVRRKAMETARDSNETTTSGKIKLVQETGKAVQAGFLIYLPVYRNGTLNITLNERRKNIVGWVYSPFRMYDFMAGLFGERAADLDVEIYDSKIISSQTKMYDSKKLSASLNPQLTSTILMNLSGHKWTVVLKTTPKLESRFLNNTAIIILIIGISISFLLTIITWLIGYKRRQTIIANAERERAESRLLKSEKRYRRLFETAKDGIIILDAYTGKIVDVNPYLIEMLGYSREELLGKELWEIGTFKNIAASKEAFLELQNKGYLRYEDMPLKTKNGKHIEVEFISNTYFVDNTKIIQCNIRDITERKLAEQKLKESEERYRLLFEASADGILIADVETKTFKFANPALCRMLGYTEHELTALSLADIHPKQDLQHVIAVFESQARGDITRETEIPCLRKDGSILHVDIHSTIITIDGKRNAVGLFRDITERKQAERALKNSEERLSLVFNNTSDMLTLMEVEPGNKLRIAAVNRSYLESIKQLISRDAIGINDIVGKYRDEALTAIGFPLENIEADYQNFLRAIASGTPIQYEQIVPFGTNNIYLESIIVPVTDTAGRCTHLLYSLRDITEGKLAELKLKESEENYRTLFQNVPIGIGITDLTGNIVIFNDSILEPGGYSRDDLIRIGKVENLYYNLSDRETLIPLLKEKGTITQHPIKFKRKDGSPYDTLLTLTIIYINDQPMIQAVIEDITKRKLSEETLKQRENSYRTLSENLPASVYRLYIRELGKMEFFNNVIEQISGYTKDELRKGEICSIDPFISSEDKPYVMEIVENSIRNNSEFEVEYRFIRKDGSLSYFYEKGKPTLGEDGKPLYIEGVIFDITERKRAEEALLESEAKLTDAMKIAKLSTWEYNFALDRFTFPDQSFTLINTTAEHEGGNIMSSEHFAQKYIYPDDRVLIEKEIRKAFETPNPAYTSYMEYRVIYAPGEIGYFAANVRIEKDADNRTIKALGVNQDITDRKRTEETLLRINKAVESSGEAICMSDPQGHHFYHNKAFTEFFEYTIEEVQAAGGGTAVYVNKDVGRKVFDTTMGGGTWNGEVEMLSKSGRKFIVLLRADSIKDENGIIVGLVGIHADITERKHAEESLKFFRMMIDKSQDAIELIDVETARFIDVNEKASIDLGYSRDELLSMSVFDIDPNQNMHDFQHIIQNIRQSNSMTVESIHRRKDGSIFPVEINIAIVKLKRTYTIANVRDITEKKLVENKLKKSEEQLKEAQSVGHIGSWEWDIDKNSGTMSDEMYKIFNIKSSSFVITLETFAEIPIPEDRKMVLEIVTKVIETHEPAAFDFRIITPNGEIRWIHERSAVEVDDEGNPKRVLGTCQDITERKLVELRLKESEERFRSITQSANDAIITADTKGIILDWNKGAEKIFGYSESVVKGKELSIMIPPIYIEKLIKGMKRIEQGGEHHVIGKTVEIRGLHKSGKEFPLELSLAEWKTSKGKFFTGIIRDITERKLAEETLRESEENFRSMFENNSAAMIIAEPDTTVSMVNDEFCKLSGYSKQEVIGTSWTAHIPPKDRKRLKEYNHGRSINVNDVPDKYEFTIYNKKGEIRHAIMSVTLLRNRKTLASFIDINERKLAEAKIKKSNEQLIKLNAEKDKFFSIIAHDLRSPFNGLLNLTALMSDSTENFSPDEFVEYSKSLNEAANNLYKLLENLLEWAQVQKGSINFAPCDTDLSKIVSQSIDTIYQRALQKSLEIINEIDNTQKVYIDEKMISTVFRNLLSNAVKFTRTNGKIFIKSNRSNNGTIEVSVEDNGVGMDEKDMIRLFKIEEKVSSVGTEGEPSTGLGLLLCKEFIEMHGGKIWVESKEGKGSKFMFTLRKSILSST